jgi:hypothetical protein
MTEQPMRQSQPQSSLDLCTGDFLEVLLQEETCYPWNPADPETETYFEQIEQNFSLIDAFDSEEITAQADRFYSCLEQCWESATTSHLKQSIAGKFGQFVPSVWLDAIAEQATQIISENLSQLDRLVMCVRPLLSNWGDEDLEVFARPLVYAMRGETSIKQAPWEELSEIERVRFSLKIAQEALHHLQEVQNVSH